METMPNAVDWTTVLLALITALVSISTAFLAYLANKNANEARVQTGETATKVDGFVTELADAKEAKGKAEGKAEVLERTQGS